MLDGGAARTHARFPMPSWTVHLVSSAGLVALVGRLPISGSVAEACVIGAVGCGVCLLGLYGNRVVREADLRLRAMRTSHLASSSPVLENAHA